MICPFCNIGIRLQWTDDGELCDKCVDLLDGFRSWLNNPHLRAALDGEG